MSARLPPSAGRAGIGLRHPHYRAFLETRPAVGFVEVHSENFFAEGGAALAVLQQAREQVPVSLHGVGLALGSAAGVDDWHLERLARLAERIEPAWVSDHACFARVAAPDGQTLHAGDLLPLAFTDEALDILCRNVDRVQSRLGRPLLVENLSAYLDHAEADWTEAAFLAELTRRTGCGLLLDLNNLVVNALNAGDADPRPATIAFFDALPPGVVQEIHLAGHRDRRADGEALVIDDHGSVVGPAVWSVYAHALRRFGRVPTLIEWDTDLPPLEVLLGEAAQADAWARRLVSEGEA